MPFCIQFIFLCTNEKMMPPQWLSGKESAWNVEEMWVWSPNQKNLQRRKWQPTPLFFPGKSQEQRSVVGYSLWDSRVYSPWGSKELIQETHWTIKHKVKIIIKPWNYCWKCTWINILIIIFFYGFYHTCRKN